MSGAAERTECKYLTFRGWSFSLKYFKFWSRSGSGKGLWGLDAVGSGYGQVAGACEYGDELSGCSIKCGEFLD